MTYPNYTLPSWFIYNDIDWHRYYPLKDGKYIYKCDKKVKGCSNDDIYDDKNVITDEEMNKLLNGYVYNKQ